MFCFLCRCMWNDKLPHPTLDGKLRVVGFHKVNTEMALADHHICQHSNIHKSGFLSLCLFLQGSILFFFSLYICCSIHLTNILGLPGQPAEAHYSTPPHLLPLSSGINLCPSCHGFRVSRSHSVYITSWLPSKLLSPLNPGRATGCFSRSSCRSTAAGAMLTGWRVLGTTFR